VGQVGAAAAAGLVPDPVQVRADGTPTPVPNRRLRTPYSPIAQAATPRPDAI